MEIKPREIKDLLANMPVIGSSIFRPSYEDAESLETIFRQNELGIGTLVR